MTQPEQHDTHLPNQTATEPLGMPVMTLRELGVNHHSEFELGLPRTLTELLSPEYQDVYISDVDGTVVDHAADLIKQIGLATGKPISRTYFAQFGYTTQIPEWQDPGSRAIHDRVVAGEDPDHFPYYNEPFPLAIPTLQLIERLGHRLCYLTARPEKLFPVTLAEFERNAIPHERNHPKNPVYDDPEPVPGRIYCAPKTGISLSTWKAEVVTGWIGNMRNRGWKGNVIVIDDLMKPYKSLLEQRVIYGISPKGDFNGIHAPYPNEKRMNDWGDIQGGIRFLHTLFTAQTPFSWRAFVPDGEQDHILVVDKKEWGIEQTPRNRLQHFAYVRRDEWDRDRNAVLEKAGIARDDATF